MRSKARKIALAALLVGLPGCASKQVLVRDPPPVELLGDCPVVVEDVRTNGGLVNTILAYRASIETCNTDKASLRKWSEDSNATSVGKP